ncbi:DUF421 domain-containing protein [Paenibacillus aceris]|uniref:Uncharacterized membrane protein YcaP (DUF421 family) n=1 Tax=Paenibacillus aceris TaxID=869555 RepID=A0ABS4HZ62_9BACL|nr:DUF421 domain-containing protein [Paenibacillus aceris]MBP1963967.1 uncharacterized membrane protein YcaP (DUF421 family) [Paenibacillus aceris]NHW34614.1 DUF421 domain-containing protein [Paenibacillus aceris]
MDFFHSQESLTSAEWVMRAVVGYFFLLIAAKLLGQRSISQLRFLDFTIALILGNIVAHPLSDEHLSLTGSMISTIVLVILYVLTSWLSLKWNFLKHFLDPAPLKLIEHGKIMLKNLRRARISVDHLFSELRKQQIEDINKVALALWEPGGIISVFLEPQYQPVTPKDMSIPTSSFSLVKPIIVEGTTNTGMLAEQGKDMVWLKSQIHAAHADLENVVLATIDDQDQIRVYTETVSKEKDELTPN